MKQTKRKFLYFTTGDFKGVQKYLNDLADKGWELVSTEHFLTGEFVRTDRTELSYYVDLVPPKEDEGEKQTYLRLCEDAGWELVGTTNEMRIFKSLPCRRPVPVQTDGEMEAGNFRRYTVRRMVGSVLYLLLVFGLNLLPTLAMRGSGYVWDSLRDGVVHGWYESWFVDVCLIVLPLLLAGLLLQTVNLAAVALWSWRSVRKRGMLPTPPWWMMYLHSTGALLLLLAVVCIWASIAADGLATGNLFACYLWLAIWIIYLLLEIFVEVSGRTYTKGQKKAMARMTAGLLACAAVVALLDWKGPWQHYETAALSSSVEVAHTGWRQEIAGQPVIRQEDLGLDRELFAAEYAHGTSLFARWWKYEEDAISTGSLKSWRYECRTEKTAQRVAEDLLNLIGEEQRIGHIVFQRSYEMAEVPVDGLDQGWYGSVTTDGATSSALVLRQGTTVALIVAPVDLKEEEYLAVLRTKLFEGSCSDRKAMEAGGT